MEPTAAPGTLELISSLPRPPHSRITHVQIGRKSFYLFSAATQAFAVGLMALWIGQGNFDLWLTSFLLVGACYGGGFGVIPAAVRVGSRGDRRGT